MEYHLASIIALRKRVEQLENQVEELTIKLEKEKQDNLINN
tara:strand:+ start:1583 stop:1705 length:123 start_codon:yes stop_codon:yes gene_type:complete